MERKVEQIVIVCERYNPPKGFGKYRLYNKDFGIYISSYNDKKVAMEHANKENVRMDKCLQVIESWNK